MLRHRIVPSFVLFATLVTISILPAMALEECRLLRQPDIQGERIVFAYGGDLWTVARDGGVAARLTTHSSNGRSNTSSAS